MVYDKLLQHEQICRFIIDNITIINTLVWTQVLIERMFQFNGSD